MKIWIFNNGNMLPKHGGLNRHYYFGKYLKRFGHEPIVFVGSHPHNTDLQLIEGKEYYKIYQENPFPWVLIKTCKYKNNKIKRVFSMFQYYFNAKRASKHFEKPDVIIGSSSHPLAALLAITLGKKYHCKKIVEIRDLWPESIVAYGILSKNNPIIRLMYCFEKWLYKKADAIIFTMEGGKDYIIEKGWDKSHGGPIDLNKVYHINNGVDLEVFDYNKEHFTINDPDLDNPNNFKVVYTGSIRRVNNLKQIVDVAEILSKSNNDKIKFLIFGDGDEREQLEKEVSQKHLDNIVFKGRIKKEQVPYVLSKADLCLFHWQSTQLIKYGASGNKSFEYLAAGKPILSNSVTGYDLIKKYQCGISKNIKTAEEYAKCIVEISNLPKDDRIIYGQNARNAAENYDFKKLSNDLIEVIENIYG